MADYRPKIKRSIKAVLINEAGGKCANPGCPNVLTEVHHIQEWCVYRSHDQAHMIALCPSCHDAVTRGGLRLDDETLYRWKTIARSPTATSAHIYLEPGAELPKLVLGSVSVQSETSFTVFELGDANDLEFCLRGDTILLPRLRIGSDADLLIEVVDGHVIRKKPDVDFLYRPGKVTVNDARLREHLPAWALPIIRNDAGLDLEEQSLLDLEATSPGVLKVQGVWVRRDCVVIVNHRQLSFIYPALQRPLTLIGEGDGTRSVLKLSGPSVLFDLSNMASPKPKTQTGR